MYRGLLIHATVILRTAKEDRLPPLAKYDIYYYVNTVYDGKKSPVTCQVFNYPKGRESLLRIIYIYGNGRVSEFVTRVRIHHMPPVGVCAFTQN